MGLDLPNIKLKTELKSEQYFLNYSRKTKAPPYAVVGSSVQQPCARGTRLGFLNQSTARDGGERMKVGCARLAALLTSLTLSSLPEWAGAMHAALRYCNMTVGNPWTII